MILIYDGNCGFCTTVASFAQKRFQAPDIEVTPWQFIDDLSAYGLSETEVAKRAYFIESDGTPYGGADGIVHGLLHMQRPWNYLGLLLRLPAFNLVAMAAYRIVARYRHRLPGGTPACKLPRTDQ